MIREPNGVGTTYRRALDLLAGWYSYATKCEENATSATEQTAYSAEADAVHDVYQLLGRASGSYADLDRLAEETMRTTVMALVLAGAPRSTGATSTEKVESKP